MDLHVPKNFKLTIIVSIILLIACIVASLAFGARVVSFQDILDGLTGKNEDSFGANIVRKRLSRTVFSLLCGAALGVSGALMQAITRNPLADPSILGVNTGASLFVVCGLAFFNISTANQYIWFALLGAALTAAFVFGIGSMGRGGATPIKLVLAGAATTAALFPCHRYFNSKFLCHGSIQILAGRQCRLRYMEFHHNLPSFFGYWHSYCLYFGPSIERSCFRG